MFISKCPICGGKLVRKTVEEFVKGNYNVALVKVKAAVCHKCGETVFDAKTARLLETLSAKLQNGEVRDLTVVGHTYLA